MTKKTNLTDDAELFRSSVGKVRSIDANTVILKPNRKPRPKPVHRMLEPVECPLQNKVGDEFETLYQEDKVAFIAPGLQKNVLKKMRKGYYGLDASIDLHGLTSREALQQLLNFLQYCLEDGSQCVCVVHGKGYHSPENQPILKNDINFWLRRHKDVLAFCSAPPWAGGAGAMFVLLRLSDKFGIGEDDI